MRIHPALFLLGALAVPVCGAVQCNLTAVLAPLRAEGLTEKLGDMVLACSGGQPGGRVRGLVQVSVSQALSNRETPAGMVDAVLQMQTAGGWTTLQDTGLATNPSTVVFQAIDVTFDGAGQLAFRVTNLRTRGNAPVTSVISFMGDPILPVPNPVARLGQPQASIASASTLVIAETGVSLPAALTFDTLKAFRVPFSSIRVTELMAAAFGAKQAGEDHGTRIRIRYTNVPPRATILVPDFLAGSTAAIQTSGGDMGLPAHAGLASSAPSGNLVLARVKGATPEGAQGVVETYRGRFGAVDATEPVGATEHQAVYEVLDSNLYQLETVQVPSFYLLPPTVPPLIIRPSASYAPLSSVVGRSLADPVPRFDSSHTVAPDCSNYLNCEAPWTPKLEVIQDGPLALSVPQGAGPASTFLLIRNTGASVLEWTVAVAYENGSGWLTPEPAKGINNATVNLQVSARNLTQGTYRATVTVASAAPVKEYRYPITLTVTPPLPPPVAAPLILTVVNAANRGSTLFAPGMAAAVIGANFRQTATVRVGGETARVLWITETEIVCVMPASVRPGPASVLVVDGDKTSNSYTVIFASAAPAVVGVLNQDGTRNSESNPAMAGSALQTYGAGVPPGGSLVARIHDIWIETPLFAGAAPGFEGLVQVNFSVPDLMPTMMTEVQLCTAPAPGEPLMCSLGYRIWVKQKVGE